jgi:hypothetical protein
VLILSCPVCGADSAPDTVFSPSLLLRCPGCDFAFLPGAPTDGLYGDMYFANYDGENYRAAERARRFESRRRLDLLARRLPPPARLLEIGGAAGFFLDDSRRRGYDGAGVELNGEMTAYAPEALGLDVRAGRVEEVDVGEQPFDAACDWHALKLPHHVGQFGRRSMSALLDGAGLEVTAMDWCRSLTTQRPARSASRWFAGRWRCGRWCALAARCHPGAMGDATSCSARSRAGQRRRPHGYPSGRLEAAPLRQPGITRAAPA